MQTMLILLGLFSLQVAAYPSVMQGLAQKRQVPSSGAAQARSQGRTNCGPTPCTLFNAQEQFVSTTGDHAYASPLPNQIRGPCPGLNAAANHGYISRSGVVGITEAITGLAQAFGLGVAVTGLLAGYAARNYGDPVANTWSIGGPFAPTVPLAGHPVGISYSHNGIESDSSLARNDAYINNNDAHSLNIARFTEAYALGVNDGSNRYTLDKLSHHQISQQEYSIANNPYYFSGPFGGTIVAPAAHFLVPNLMSNHSAEEPSGYLDGNIFKTFFGITGDYPNFTWLPGQERIPENWYRRPTLNQYNADSLVGDLAITFSAYPSSLRSGGNINGVNSYEGVDLTDITGGAYSNADLTNVDDTTSIKCFIREIVTTLVNPDQDSAIVAAAKNKILTQYIQPFSGALDCPAIDEYDQAVLSQYPGSGYDPTGPAQNYK